ncbi:MAG: hypothetical protein SynsKO_40990 [Synoicihabitans sp.]
MPSGFIILRDGRCFARRWAIYDEAIRATIRYLPSTDAGAELGCWLDSLIPTDEDTESIGYGPWLRAKDEKIIERYIDLRCLTSENLTMIEDAVLSAHDTGDGQEGFIEVFADMVRRCRAGEEPLSLSDWTKVEPAPDDRIGPGWDTAKTKEAEQGGGRQAATRSEST